MNEYQGLSSGKVVSSVMARIQKTSARSAPKSKPELRLVRPTLSQSVCNGARIRVGNPVEMGNFDDSEDTILFAYDPVQTPDPEFDLLDGKLSGEKVLTMNGQHMVQIANAASLVLADIMIIEIALAA